MADSSYEKGLSELSKLKVADLKIELKQRGLSTAGNKNELVERLQNAMNGESSLSPDEPTEEIFDEDAVLGDEEMAELSSNPDLQEVMETCKETSESKTSSAKKIILNRKPVTEELKTEQKIKVIEDTVTNDERREEKSVLSDGLKTDLGKDIVLQNKKKENVEKKNEKVILVPLDATPKERRVIKLSKIGVKERLEMRAKKFGMPLSDAAKKEARIARFNLYNQNDKSASSIKTPVITTYEVLKKRAKRFGTTGSSSLLEKVELEEKIAKRKERFGEVLPLKTVNQKKIKIVK